MRCPAKSNSASRGLRSYVYGNGAGRLHADAVDTRHTGISVGLEASWEVQQQVDDHVYAVIRKSVARWAPATGRRISFLQQINHGSYVLRAFSGVAHVSPRVDDHAADPFGQHGHRQRQGKGGLH